MADTNKNDGAPVGAIMAGVAALSAAAVGAYYLYGHKDAKKHRGTVKGWMLKAKGEVLEELEKAKDVTEDTYTSAVDAVAQKYNELKQIDPVELESFVSEMRSHWTGIKKTFATKAPVRKASKTAKKPAARKTSKK